MTFWLLVGCGYLLLLVAGLALGRLIAAHRHGPGRGGSARPEAPAPSGPSFVLDWPPLGTAFDRELLPGVFDGDPVREAV